MGGKGGKKIKGMEGRERKGGINEERGVRRNGKDKGKEGGKKGK